MASKQPPLMKLPTGRRPAGISRQEQRGRSITRNHGPQLNARWPARYATVLADDPGSSVLKGGPKEAVKTVKTDAVRQESVRRTSRWSVRWPPRTLHADPDASSRWLNASHIGNPSEDTKHHRLFRALDRYSVAAVDARPPDADHRHIGGAGRTHGSAEPDGGADVRASRGHERVAVHADTPHGTSIEGTTEIARNLVEEIGQLEGVARMPYIAGADRYTPSSTSSPRTRARSRSLKS
jgi:hypothetical protein